MKQIKQYTGICALMLLCMAKASAQQGKGINSFYSAFGVGDLEERDYSRNFGVGSTGIGRNSETFLNDLNPASYSAIPRQNFMFDVSLRGQSIRYTNGSNINQNAGDVNLKRVAIGFKINNRWGASIGLSPYSTVDYKLLSTQYVGNIKQETTTEGNGGINKVYISNGVKLTKNFSVGVSVNFLFGPNNIVQNVGGDTVSTRTDRYAFNTNFNTGIQYTGKIGEWQLGLGATYRLETKMRYSKTQLIVNANDETLFKEDQGTERYTLPAQYGAGFSLGNGTITWLGDWRRQMWGDVKNSTTNYKTSTGDRFSTGIEYSFRRYYYNQQIEGIVLQAGFSYNNSYLVVKGNQIKDISGTAGVSIPNRSGRLNYYVGLEVGQRGTINSGLIRENYVNAVLHFSFRDLWFLRRTYD